MTHRRSRRFKAIRVVAGSLAAAVMLVMIPFTAASRAGLTDDPLSLPTPTPSPSPLPEDPVGSVTDAVNSVLSPSPSPSPPLPTTLDLTPPWATNTVGTPHTVMANVKDQNAANMVDIAVRFSVTGANPGSGSAVTNATGNATFTYTGSNTGTDTITAFADTNGDNLRQSTEPQDTATRTWTAPTTSSGSDGSGGSSGTSNEQSSTTDGSTGQPSTRSATAPQSVDSSAVQVSQSTQIADVDDPRPRRAIVPASTDYRRSYGLRSTAEIFDILESLGKSPAEIARILAPFPVAGPASYSDDWGEPRYNPFEHPHEGTDIFAPRGTPVIASTDGVVSNLQIESPVAGTSLRLTAADGTYYFYAHLDRFAPNLSGDAKVRMGDLLGFVGDTGNAEGGPPHLHFEIHPQGAAAVPPVPYLDRWLAEALDTAKALQASASPQGFVASIRSVVMKFAGAAGLVARTTLAAAKDSLTPGNLASWVPVLGISAFLLVRARRRGLLVNSPRDRKGEGVLAVGIARQGLAPDGSVLSFFLPWRIRRGSARGL